MNGKLKLIDFMATWCGPCQAMKPVLKKFEAAHPEVEIEVVDIDRNHAKADKYGIQCVPTFIVEVDGEIHKQSSGACSLRELERLLPKASTRKASKKKAPATNRSRRGAKKP